MKQALDTRQYLTMCVGECFGTFLLVFIGTGSVAAICFRFIVTPLMGVKQASACACSVEK